MDPVGNRQIHQFGLDFQIGMNIGLGLVTGQGFNGGAQYTVAAQIDPGQMVKGVEQIGHLLLIIRFPVIEQQADVFQDYAHHMSNLCTFLLTQPGIGGRGYLPDYGTEGQGLCGEDGAGVLMDIGFNGQPGIIGGRAGCIHQMQNVEHHLNRMDQILALRGVPMTGLFGPVEFISG